MPRAQGTGLVAAGLVCSIPFLNPLHGLPIPTFYEEWLAFALGLAGVLVVGVASPGAGRFPRVALWLVAFAPVLVLQWALRLTAYRETVELGVLYVLWAALLVWLGAQLRERCGAERTARVLAGFIVAGALANGAVALLQAATGTGGLGALLAAPGGGRVYGLTGQANLLANHLALGLAALLYLLVTGAMRVRTAAAFGLALVTALAFTGSRTAWLLVAWLVACGLLGRSTGGRAALHGAAAIGASLVVLQLVFHATGGVGFATRDGSALGRLADEVAQGHQPVGGIAARLFVWRVALDIFATAPLLGVGVGEFAWAYFNAHPPEHFALLGSYQRHAHNLVLQLLAETGLAGAVPITLGLLGWLVRVAKAQVAQWHPATWLALAVVGIESTHSVIEFPLWHAQFPGVAALFLGVGERRAVALRSALAARWMPALLGLAGLSLAAGAMWWHLQLRTWVYALPDAALAEPGVRERQRDVLRRAGATLLRPYAELPIAAAIEPRRSHVTAQLALNGRTLRFAPIGPVVYRQVTLLALAGERERAAALLERALVLHPGLRGEYARALAPLAAVEPAALGWVLERVRQRP
ncbi:MAG: Wzy polymerase domain-containing protein [Burkholderiales bacterium]|nr:Wzy polymerase domain-containing protein [Burkholderiales bacterium]